ncbi:unnamed protein product [Blepharisma stoltei]|uniref:RING-type domain-containing protein n=1 Tax=Blepharisma stoltei TaxID=1481888 RepID=A0AAU9JUN6_9CILI|nr:unnamed protein product [Blepharisma stoltei]
MFYWKIIWHHPYLIMQSGQSSTCPCSSYQLGNGICDKKCNTHECEWDNGDCNSSHSSSSIITYVIIMTTFLFFLIAAVAFIYLMKRYKRRISKVSPEILENYEFVAKFATKALISFSVQTEDETRDCNAICAICLEVLQKGDIKLITSCSHEFHAECIDQWLKWSEKKWCPCCKQEI